MEHIYNSHEQVNHHNIHKHNGDFLLTHDFTWITEEEFYRFIMRMEEEVWGEYDKSL